VFVSVLIITDMVAACVIFCIYIIFGVCVIINILVCVLDQSKTKRDIIASKSLHHSTRQQKYSRRRGSKKKKEINDSDGLLHS
jgi:hypothetical protein